MNGHFCIWIGSGTLEGILADGPISYSMVWDAGWRSCRLPSGLETAVILWLSWIGLGWVDLIGLISLIEPGSVSVVQTLGMPMKMEGKLAS